MYLLFFFVSIKIIYIQICTYIHITTFSFFFFFFKIKMGWVVGVRGGRVLDIPILHITTDCHAPPLSFPFSLSLSTLSSNMYVDTIQYCTVHPLYPTQPTHPNARTLRPARHTYVMYLTLHCTQSTADLFFSSPLLKNCHLFFFLSFCLSVFLFLFLFPLGGVGGWGLGGGGGNVQEIPIHPPTFYNTFSNQKINFYYFYLFFFLGHTQKKKLPVFEFYIFMYVCMYVCVVHLLLQRKPSLIFPSVSLSLSCLTSLLSPLYTLNSPHTLVIIFQGQSMGL